MGSDIDTLVDMGFSRGKVQKAWKAVNGAGLQPAMDWLLSHPEVSDEPEEEPQGKTLTGAGAAGTNDAAEDEGEIQQGEQTAQSLVCNDCQKLFRDAAAAERHAIKTQHQDFSESTEVIKPLTEEEKKQKLAELKARLAEKRAQQAQESIEEQKQAERLRRKTGRDIGDVREELKAKEMKKAIDQKKKEKEADKLAKLKIKQQIEQDKLERKAKREGAKAKEAAAAAAPLATSSQPPAAPKGDYTEARLQIRVPNRGPLTHTFAADAQLQQVIDHLVGLGIALPFTLATTFPRKIFGPQDSQKTLKELNLVPSAALALNPN